MQNKGLHAILIIACTLNDTPARAAGTPGKSQNLSPQIESVSWSSQSRAARQQDRQYAKTLLSVDALRNHEPIQFVSGDPVIDAPPEGWERSLYKHGDISQTYYEIWKEEAKFS